MVQAADLWPLHDLARRGELDRPELGCVLVEREMRATLRVGPAGAHARLPGREGRRPGHDLVSRRRRGRASAVIGVFNTEEIQRQPFPSRLTPIS